jgi:hypothetical protein
MNFNVIPLSLVILTTFSNCSNRQENNEPIPNPTYSSSQVLVNGYFEMRTNFPAPDSPLTFTPHQTLLKCQQAVRSTRLELFALSQETKRPIRNPSGDWCLEIIEGGKIKYKHFVPETSSN